MFFLLIFHLWPYLFLIGLVMVSVTYLRWKIRRVHKNSPPEAGASHRAPIEVDFEVQDGENSKDGKET